MRVKKKRARRKPTKLGNSERYAASLEEALEKLSQKVDAYEGVFRAIRAACEVYGMQFEEEDDS